VPGNKGYFEVLTRPDWAPIGVQRLEELVSVQFYDETRIFRVIPNFVAQFGINGDPNIQKTYKIQKLIDDPVKQSNLQSTVTFAMSGPNTRTTQIFVNTNNNSYLDEDGFAPVAQVTSGMDVVKRFYSGYGDVVNQVYFEIKGNDWLTQTYPKFSYIERAYFVQ